MFPLLLSLSALGVGWFLFGRKSSSSPGLGETSLDQPVQFRPGTIPAGKWGRGRVTREQGGGATWVVATFPFQQAGLTDSLVVAAVETDPRVFVNFIIKANGAREELRVETGGAPLDPNAVRKVWGLATK
jgi:hypothetical protein